jgi:hypothetical protein
MIPTVPPPLRHRLAETILAALHDEAARRELSALAGASEGALPLAWQGPDDPALAPALIARARRAVQALTDRPLVLPSGSLDETLEAAATLFDAGLYFEVHEALEPRWMSARGAEREGLQGLIQIAVGYQHLANGNLAGARSLLAEGAGRVSRARVDALETDAFLLGVRASLDRLSLVADSDVPRFPRRATSATGPAPTTSARTRED